MRQQSFSTRKRLAALTGLRFLAAFYVVVSHGFSWIQQHIALPESLLPLARNGPLAVALFFLLSGFLLSYTYEGNLTGKHEFALFWEARFARIYPVYLLSLVLALPFQLGLSFPTRLAVLTMTQAWNPLHHDWAGAWNYPAWSLSVEAFFYSLFPFLQRRVSRVSNSTLLTLAACTALVCVLGHTPLQSIADHDQFPFESRLLVLPLVRLPEFLLGMFLGNYFLRGGEFLSSPFYSYLSAVAVMLLVSLPIGRWVSFVVIPFAMLIYGLASSSNLLTAFLSSRVMLLLGGASYAVYLLQAPFRDWVRVISEYALGEKARLVTPLTPILLVFFSIAIFRWFEEPIRKKIKGRFVSKTPSVQD